MIVVKLMGGLGNQMFQYAFGKALEAKFNTSVFFDKSWFDQKFEGVTPRTLGLDVFNISPQYTNLENPLFKTKIGRFIKYALKKIGLKNNYIKVNEDAFPPDQSLNIRNNIYFEGYWQNHEYFSSIRESVLKDFSFPELSDLKDLILQKTILNCESVAVHIRRGDYISNPTTNQFHGICSEEYYKKAANKILSEIPDAKFFLFTDDPDFVKANFNFLHDAVLVSNNNRSEIDELNIMHLCKHFIIANSSFSWWGAWLSQNPNKIVIAPQQWFQNTEANEKCKIVPKDWVRI